MQSLMLDFYHFRSEVFYELNQILCFHFGHRFTREDDGRIDRGVDGAEKVGLGTW